MSPDELNPAVYNPRTITDDALGRLAVLLDEHGFVDPIIARREDGLVIGGHQRLKANAKRKKPDTEVPVVYLDNISDDRAKALNVSLNNTQAMGEYDTKMLADLLIEIDANNVDVVTATGFNTDEIDLLMESVNEELAKSGIVDVDIAPQSTVWIFMGVPLDDYGDISVHVEAIQNIATVTCQVARSDNEA